MIMNSTFITVMLVAAVFIGLVGGTALFVRFSGGAVISMATSALARGAVAAWPHVKKFLIKKVFAVSDAKAEQNKKDAREGVTHKFGGGGKDR